MAPAGAVNIQDFDFSQAVAKGRPQSPEVAPETVSEVVPNVAAVVEPIEAILQANPFDRRRGYRPTAPVVKRGPSLPRLNVSALVGLVSLGDIPHALIRTSSNRGPRLRRLAVGEQLGEWRLVEIADASVVFSYAEQKKTINMKRVAASVASAFTPAVRGVGSGRASNSTSSSRPVTVASRSQAGGKVVKVGLVKPGTYTDDKPPPEGYRLIKTPFGPMLRKN